MSTSWAQQKLIEKGADMLTEAELLDVMVRVHGVGNLILKKDMTDAVIPRLKLAFSHPALHITLERVFQNYLQIFAS